MRYKVTVEIIDKMAFSIDADHPTGEDHATGCKVTMYGSKWPRADKCAPDVACPRCTAMRAIEDKIIPDADGCEVKFDKIEPIISAAWAIGEEGEEK